LGKDSPEVTTEVSATTTPDSEPLSVGNIDEERLKEISFSSDTSASSLIKRFENFTPVATLDVSQNTNGFGTEATDDSEEITMEVAQERLLARVAEDTAFIENFNEQYQYDWTENEIVALTSFIFNLGKRSLNEVTEGGTRSKEEIADAMLLYTGAGGKRNIPGLITRRQDEYDIFTGKVTI
jgi:GH24 family phage-related lysozyme (muramidase)